MGRLFICHTSKNKKRTVRIMTVYRSEILKVSFKWMTASIKEEEIAQLDDLINKRSSSGWELVTYAFMGDAESFGRGILITFKKD